MLPLLNLIGMHHWLDEISLCMPLGKHLVTMWCVLALTSWPYELSVPVPLMEILLPPPKLPSLGVIHHTAAVREGGGGAEWNTIYHLIFTLQGVTLIFELWDYSLNCQLFNT